MAAGNGCHFFVQFVLADATDFLMGRGYTKANRKAGGMGVIYLDLVMGLNFIVDLLLLVGTNGLAGHPPAIKRALLASALGGIYGGICLVPGFYFLGHTFWRLIFLGLISGIAFGWNRGAVRRGILFVLLSMALGGMALGLGSGSVLSLLFAAAGVMILCVCGFRGKAGVRQFSRLELVLDGKRRTMTALRDTGNSLRDPVSGRQVIVVGAQAARELTGLSPGELATPIETMEHSPRPGLRLIPYRAVGQPAGMLLGMCMDEVWLDGKKCGHIVAFAPQEMGQEGYEALAGGMA